MKYRSEEERREARKRTEKARRLILEKLQRHLTAEELTELREQLEEALQPKEDDA